MTTSTRLSVDYGSLVLEDRAHSSIFTSPEIFEDELENIFTRGWVYVAHTSEVPEPGDYVTRWMGRVPVLLVRDEDGAVRLFVNRCRHRGNMVCQYERGNSMYFTCPYHGYTYSSRGDLVGIPRADAYGDAYREEVTGLALVPRMSVYRGFVFASLAPGEMTLEEHLGESCMRMIDLFCDASPAGEIELRAGVHRHSYGGNWKQIGMDGYHAQIVHESFFSVRQKRADVPRYQNRQRAEYGARDLGQGHAMLDMRFKGGTFGAILACRDKPWFPDYETSLERAHGAAWVGQVIGASGDPHLHVYPNLELIDSHVRVIHPLSVDQTVIYMYPALLKGAPDELNELRLRTHESFYGPASGGNPDDYEVFERTQLGMMGEVNPWIMLARGLDRQHVDYDDPSIPGTLLADGSDEITQRGQLMRWKADMMARRLGASA